jgi:cell division protein FtsB
VKVNSNRLVVIVAGFAVAAALGAPCTASADLFYTPSQYNRLYSDKVAVELELKMLKRQYRNELDNLKKENSGLKGRIEALTGRLDLLTKRCEEELN